MHQTPIMFGNKLSVAVFCLLPFTTQGTFMDIPDVNQMYTGTAAIDALCQPVTLMDSAHSQYAPNDRAELEYVMQKKMDILEMIADEYQLNVFPRTSPSPTPLFAGDILLTRAQVQAIAADLKESIDQNRQPISIDLAQMGDRVFKRWPNAYIHIEFSKEVDDDRDLKRMIHEAMWMWTRHSCVNFKIGNRRSQSEPYLLFTKTGACASYLGYSKKVQPIHVGPGCSHVGVIAHLIGHALGLFHEHQQPYRDQNLLIRWEHVKPDFLDSFLLSRTQLRHSDRATPKETPYDYASIMHGKCKAFSKDASIPTMEPTDAGFAGTMGNKRNVTYFDIVRLNDLYCPDKCAHKKFSCNYAGHWNPKYDQCNVPVCPEGYHGQKCGQLERSGPEYCGGLHFAQETWKYLQTPNYPEKFPAGQTCVWHIRGPPRHVIELQFVDEFEMSQCDPCLKNYVEVRGGALEAHVGYRFCGTQKPQSRMYSESNFMQIYMRGLDPDGLVQKGFKARYRILPQNSASIVRPTPPTRSRDTPLPMTECKQRLSEQACDNLHSTSPSCHVTNDLNNTATACPVKQLCPQCMDAEMRQCHDDLNSLQCFVHYLQAGNCETWRAKKRCRLTCGHCSPPEHQISKCHTRELCESMTAEMCQLEHLRKWCQPCGICTPSTTQAPTTSNTTRSSSTITARRTTTTKKPTTSTALPSTSTSAEQAQPTTTTKRSHPCDPNPCFTDERCITMNQCDPNGNNCRMFHFCERREEFTRAQHTDAPVRQETVTAVVPEDPCDPNPCTHGDQCFAGPPCFNNDRNCKRFKCLPTTRRWRGITQPATTPPPNSSCRNTMSTEQCLLDVVSNDDCDTFRGSLCKETCGKCSSTHPDPCRQQRRFCSDGTLCATDGPLRTWCSLCDQCTTLTATTETSSSEEENIYYYL